MGKRLEVFIGYLYFLLLCDTLYIIKVKEEQGMEKNMFLYETHVHTSPVSRCAGVNVRDTLSFYKSLGYAGVFMTDHFIDGNINIERTAPYADRINLFFSAYEEGVEIGKELGISVFCGLVFGKGRVWNASQARTAFYADGGGGFGRAGTPLPRGELY